MSVQSQKTIFFHPPMMNGIKKVNRNDRIVKGTQPSFFHELPTSDAVESAQREEERMRRALEEKQNRLKEFQEKEKDRVRIYKALKQEVIQQRNRKECHVDENSVKQSLLLNSPRYCMPPLSTPRIDDGDPSDDELRVEVSNRYMTQIQTCLTVPKEEAASCTQDENNHMLSIRSGDGSASSSRSRQSRIQASPRVAARSLDIRFFPGLLEVDDPVQEPIRQRAAFRRAYSELERDRVRRAKFKERADVRAKLIKDKAEVARQEEEAVYDGLLEESLLGSPCASNRTPVPPLSLDGVETGREEVATTLESSRSSQRQISRKSKDTERYTDALMQSLKERCEKLGVCVPPLCVCSDDVWTTNPNTCANNCIFYRNHKAFLKALHGMIISLDVK